MKHLLILYLLFMGNQAFTQVNQAPDSCQIFVSDHLTRNDGEYLVIDVSCEIKQFKFKIFTRFGVLLYESDSLKEPMDLNLSEKIIVDGKEQYKFLENEVCIWVLTYSMSGDHPNSKLREATGVISIL